MCAGSPRLWRSAASGGPSSRPEQRRRDDGRGRSSRDRLAPLSGPAAGIGALGLYGRALATQDLISMEIGGTSCDVTLLSKTACDVANEFDLGGYHVALPSIDIHSVGAGGGTIAAARQGGPAVRRPARRRRRPRAQQLRPGRHRADRHRRAARARSLAAGAARRRPLARLRARASAPLRAHRPAAGALAREAAAGMLTLLDQQLFHAVQKISAERGPILGASSWWRPAAPGRCMVPWSAASSIRRPSTSRGSRAPFAHSAC